MTKRITERFDAIAAPFKAKLSSIESKRPDYFQKLSDFFVGRLRAGQQDFDGWREINDLAQIHDDGSTWFYRLPEALSLPDFTTLAEIAWERDSEHSLNWPPFRVYFD